MMRVMRKILKRKVSIVMAVLVILGIAVYGVSAFAEEQTATAETFTVNPNYIYLNPAGMNLGSVDWTNSSADIRLNVTGWDAKNQGHYDKNSGYWYWDATNWEIKDANTYFFTYGTDWGVINSKPYYRTEVSSDILAKGKVYAQNGPASTKIEDQDVYALKEYTSNAGQSLTFVDMKASNLSGVQAQFSLDGNYDASTSEHVTALQLSDGKVTVPNDVNGKAYQYVRFIDAQNNAITDSFDISTAISKGGILYYGIRQDSSKTYSEWSQEKKSETTPNVTKLYFNNLSFRTSDDITIQIGSGEPVKVVPDDTATNTLSYNISGTIDKDTIISITKNGVTYRFYPNGTDNLITYSGSNICIKGTYQASSLNTVYFDATLSKLSYAGDVTDNSLPLKDAGIRYHAWNNENDFKDGDLKKLEDFSDGTHTWSDVYQAALDKKYSHILFYSSTDGTIPSTPTANKTYDLTIPADLTNPCFYADTSDDSIYKPTNRSGYWGELYTVRNAEGKDAAKIISRINGFTYVQTNFDFFTGKLEIVNEKPYSNGPRAAVKCYGANDVREGVAIMHHEGVDVSITGNSTNPTRFQHPVAGTYKKECIEEGKKYFSVASGGGTGRTLHPDNMAAGPASYGMTDTLGRMHSDAQFAGSSSVPAHVEMMGLIGAGNNPMVGMTVAVAVSVEEAAKAGKF